MHRQHVIALLNAYSPLSLQEKNAKERILKFVQQHSKCFERALKSGHLTASCWLIDHSETKFLLMHHAKLDKWLQLGGHCDGNANVLEVAIKEAREESGIKNIIAVSDAIFDLDVHLIPPYENIPSHYHYDIRFLLKVCKDEKLAINRESKELKWFSKNDPLPTQESSILRMHAKWLNQIFR